MIKKLFAYYWDMKSKQIDKLDLHESALQKAFNRWDKAKRSAMADKHDSVLRKSFKRHHKEE